MEKTIISCFIIIMLATVPLFAETKINVVTTTLELSDFVQQIGGESVDVKTISSGAYDLHFFEPSPAHIMMVRDADILVIAGMDLDVWVRELIDASRNREIRFGRKGFVDASDGITAIDVPETVDAGMGHVHPQGNPHYWFTPNNVSVAINNIHDALVRISPENASYFKENKERYLEKVNNKYDELIALMLPYKGTKILQYHETWEYFCETFGLEIYATLEPLPGIPPSARHLRNLVSEVRDSDVKLLIAEPYYPNRPVRFVERELPKIEILRLPHYMGGEKGANTYLEHLEFLVKEIVNALENLQS